MSIAGAKLLWLEFSKKWKEWSTLKMERGAKAWDRSCNA